jgi:soluble lytic murein transglycosylase
MGEYEAGQGRNAMPALEDVKAQVRAEIGNSRPERLKLALASVEDRYNDQLKAIKQKDDATVADAMRAVIQNKGRYAELPPELRAAIPPAEVGKVMDFAQRIAKGDDTTNLAVYQKLSDPNSLKSLSDDQFFALRTQLSESDFKHFSGERVKALTGNVTNGPGELNSAAIKSTLDDRLSAMGLSNLVHAKPDTDEAMRMGAVRKFVNDSVAVAQKNSGKKMTDVEVQQYLDKMFAATATYDKMFGNGSGSMFGMDAGNIPGKAKDALKTAFKANGIDDPSDGQLLDAYWRGLTQKK